LKVNDKVLKKCAKICADENGDCRRALQLLLKGGELSNGVNLTIEDVEKAFKALNTEKCEQIIENATPHQKALLGAFAKKVLQTEKEEQPTKEIFTSYMDTCYQFGLRPLLYRRSSDLLAELENTGIIVSHNKSNGRFGYRKYYSLTNEFNLVGHLINPNWWYDQKCQHFGTKAFVEEAKEKYRLAKKMNRY